MEKVKGIPRLVDRDDALNDITKDEARNASLAKFSERGVFLF